MAELKVGDKFKCSVCGNVVVLTKVGGGTLMCCSKSMEKIGKQVTDTSGGAGAEPGCPEPYSAEARRLLSNYRSEKCSADEREPQVHGLAY